MVVEPPKTPIEVDADPEQLHQVLLNLLLNAFDAVRRDGQVTIRIQAGQTGCAVVTVADSGSGISQAVRDRLFEPFVSTKESGTGLGLTICRRIVEDHGGQIEAADSPEGGAIVTVTLPITDQPVSDQAVNSEQWGNDQPTAERSTSRKPTNGKSDVPGAPSINALRRNE